MVYKNKHSYIQQNCAHCGKERLVRIVKGIPNSKLCHYCAVRSPEYRANMAAKTRNNYANGMYATQDL